MSGLVTAGVLLCGLPHAMAESVPQNNETYYSVNVPSEISLSPDQDETTFTVSGNTYQKRWLDIDITSKNNFYLKNGQASIPYKLDKTKFEYEPQYVDKDSDSFSESIKVSKNEADVKYSGNYQDQLQFTMNPIETRTIQLDCNGGTVNGKDKVAYTVKNGSSYGQLPVPVRSGYDFVAWKDDKGNTIYTKSIVDTATEQLKATFSPTISSGIACSLNGNKYITDLSGIGQADVYDNDTLLAKNCNNSSKFVVEYGHEIVFKNIRLAKCIRYKGVNKPNDGCYVVLDDDGNLSEIHVKSSIDGVIFNLDFISVSEIEETIENTNAKSIVFDKDEQNKNECIAELTSFQSKACAYLSNESLHIYNPDGGRVIAPEDCQYLFANINATTLDLTNLDMSKAMNCSYMFANCTAENINVSNWKTSNINNIAAMFYYCINLTNLNITSWNTSNVNNAWEFLWGCENLKEFDMRTINLSNNKNFSRMFGQCYKLEKIYGLEHLSTKNATGMAAMFQNCRLLKEIDISSFDTSNVSYMHYMFAYCTSLEKIVGLENLDTSKCRNFRSMFSDCWKISELKLAKFNTDNATDFSNMFANCKSLRRTYATDDFKTTTNSECLNMFLNCYNIQGEKGTTYVNTFIDSTGARIDGGPSNPGYFTAISQKPIETGSVINIEGSDYIVLDKKDTNKYLVISKDSICNKAFQSIPRNDGQSQSTYENSEIDNYLETEWFISLSSNIKNAISITKIKQVSYDDNLKKQETGYNGQTFNTIDRHVFLPSVEDLKGLVDLENTSKVKEFLGQTSIWTRDSNYNYANDARYLYVGYGGLGTNYVAIVNGIRSTFVIDLSKVNYTVTGTVNYK